MISGDETIEEKTKKLSTQALCTYKNRVISDAVTIHNNICITTDYKKKEKKRNEEREDEMKKKKRRLFILSRW